MGSIARLGHPASERFVEGAASGGVRPQHPRRLDGGALKEGRAREKDPERSQGQVPEILLGSCENTHRADLGKVVGGLFVPGADTIPRASEIFTDRLQPLGMFEEGPSAFQDHEARAEHPAHRDEVENDLPPGVPITLALTHLAEGLAGESRRNEVGPHVLSPWVLSSMG